MAIARFVILRLGKHWAIERNGSVSGEYLSRESAFEITAAEVSNAIKVGDRIEIVINAPASDEPALGTPE